MPNDARSGNALVESILAHEQASAERDRLEIDSDPKWRKVLANPEYKKLNQQLKTQMAKLRADMPWPEKMDTPAILKLLQGIQLVEQRLGADRRALWERADTPERFRDGLLRFADPFLCTTVAESQWAVIHEMFTKALELSIKFDLPAPPEPPGGNVTVEHRRNYLLKLRDWSYGKNAVKSDDELPARTLATTTEPAQARAARDTAHANQFPPLTFVDSGGGEYRFSSPLLWELWRAIYSSRYPITFDDMADGRIPSWHETLSGDDAKERAIKDLRKHWRSQTPTRDDLAKRIKINSRTVFFDKS
jgi:hypothetical protein